MSDGADIAGLDAACARHGYVIGLAGWSGSGKTTLAERLIEVLTVRGLDVATIKHAHHAFDADTPGKDSYRHRAAGARQVIVSSQARSVVFTENQTLGEASLGELLHALAPADIVIVEGYKREAIPKIEIHRAEIGKPPLFPGDPLILAVATKGAVPPEGNPPRSLDLDDIEAIAAHVCDLAGRTDVAAAS